MERPAKAARLSSPPLALGEPSMRLSRAQRQDKQEFSSPMARCSTTSTNSLSTWVRVHTHFMPYGDHAWTFTTFYYVLGALRIIEVIVPTKPLNFGAAKPHSNAATSRLRTHWHYRPPLPTIRHHTLPPYHKRTSTLEAILSFFRGHQGFGLPFFDFSFGEPLHPNRGGM